MTVAEGVKQCYNSGSWIFYCRVGAFTKQSRTLKSLAETNLIVFEPGMGVRCAKSDVFVGGAVLRHSFSKVRCFFRGWGKAFALKSRIFFWRGRVAAFVLQSWIFFSGGGEAFALKSRMFFWRGRFAAFVCKVGWVFLGGRLGWGVGQNKYHQINPIKALDPGSGPVN